MLFGTEPFVTSINNLLGIGRSMSIRGVTRGC